MIDAAVGQEGSCRCAYPEVICYAARCWPQGRCKCISAMFTWQNGQHPTKSVGTGLVVFRKNKLPAFLVPTDLLKAELENLVGSPDLLKDGLAIVHGPDDWPIIIIMRCPQQFTIVMFCLYISACHLESPNSTCTSCWVIKLHSEPQWAPDRRCPSEIHQAAVDLTLFGNLHYRV